MLHTSYLDEIDIGRYPSEVWWAYFNTLWQHKCNKHIQKSSHAFQNKAHPHQIPLSKGTSNRKWHQARICWDQGANCRHFYKTLAKGDIQISQTEVRGNSLSKELSMKTSGDVPFDLNNKGEDRAERSVMTGGVRNIIDKRHRLWWKQEMTGKKKAGGYPFSIDAKGGENKSMMIWGA